MASELITHDETPSVLGPAVIYDVNWSAQRFTVTQDFYPSRIDLRVARTGSPGTLNVEIRAIDTGTDAPGSVVAGYGTINANFFVSGSANATWQTIRFISTSKLTTNNTYAIICYAASGDGSNVVHWWQTSTGNGDTGYSGGYRQGSSNSGSTWFTGGALAIRDALFKIWGHTPAQWFAWPHSRDTDYNPDYWWSDVDFDWKTSSGLDLAGLMVGAGLQNNIVVVGADTSTGVPVIYFGVS